jgi:hypothetical protein
MSVTAVGTSAGAGGRSGSASWPLDGYGWYKVIPGREPAEAGAVPVLTIGLKQQRDSAALTND